MMTTDEMFAVIDEDKAELLALRRSNDVLLNAMVLIAAIAGGSTTVNSLQNIHRIAGSAIANTTPPQSTYQGESTDGS